MKLLKMSEGYYINTDFVRYVETMTLTDQLVLRVSPMTFHVVEDTDENRAILGLPLKHADAKTLSTNPFEEMLAKAVSIKPDEIPQKKVKKKSPHSK